MSEPEFVFVTKYALTAGIQRKLVRIAIGSYAVGATEPDKHLFLSVGHWHRSFADAQARAESMRKAKIASLKKSMAKFERMDFSEEPS